MALLCATNGTGARVRRGAACAYHARGQTTHLWRGSPEKKSQETPRVGTKLSSCLFAPCLRGDEAAGGGIASES